jgi:polyisoprenoid-binding protein YceI
MKKIHLCLLLAIVCFSGSIQAAKYKIDIEGTHAFITFKIKHLGYSWLLGRFNEFDGEFEYDASQPEKSSISVLINTASIDSNHAERDKHLRDERFLDVKKFPEAKFVSKKITATDAENAIVVGDFTLHGITKEISFPVQKVGEGKDPWGGYRAGFTGKTELKLSDYGITYNLGPASTIVEIELNIEGIRQ